MITALSVPSSGAAPGHMPCTFKAGVPFGQLVEEARLLRVDDTDDTLPRADTLWYHLTHEQDLRVRAFCRVLLWLGLSETHRAFDGDLEVPACVREWVAADLTPDRLRATFAAQLDAVWRAAA